jgi:hypothetical protein
VVFSRKGFHVKIRVSRVSFISRYYLTIHLYFQEKMTKKKFRNAGTPYSEHTILDKVCLPYASKSEREV